MRILVPLLLLALLLRPACGQAPADSSGIHFKRLVLLGGAGAAGHYLGYRYFNRAWYQGRKLDHIRWIWDWYGDAYLDMDKGGHFMSGMFLAQSLTDAYAWAGLGRRVAAVSGTLTSWVLLLEVEMKDSHFDQWGFSTPDFTANTIGATIPLIHTLLPASRAVNFKFSYFPSALYLDHKARTVADRPHFDYLIDDYEGMTFWMALSVDEVLWGRPKEVWPDWLNLALGYGVTGLQGNFKSKGRDKHYKDLPDAQPELFLALDYDTRYLPGDGWLWSHFKTQLNLLHFPAPALRVYPDWRFYLLFL